ncbi:MAG: histidine phosphatase family protein [Candidatus Paceibacterota bacterium]|jgi:broad specificity phosphatase PhoE
MEKIYFIRHGETTGDVENRYGGDYDDHLSEEGVRQAGALAEILGDKGIEVIFASPLIRAQETAQILSEKSGSEIKTVPNLKERNQYGILTGMEKGEAKEKYPEMALALKDRLNTIEGAESYQDFSDRLVQAFDEIVSLPGLNTIAIVTHGGPVRVLFRDLLKWGELSEIGDCAWVGLEKKADGTFAWLNSGGLKTEFEVPN